MEFFKGYLKSIEQLQDPRTEGFWLLGSPLNILYIIGVYLLFNLKAGPEFMKNREPFQLKTFMTCVNLGQVICNAYFVIRYIPTMKHMSLTCAVTPPDSSPATMEAIKMHYFYLLLKVADFLDTFVFTLRKKQSQVTFLHLFHHIGMICVVWTSCNAFPGGVPGWSAWINCCVHFLMYGYYLISSRMKVENKWKKLITTTQIASHWVILSTFAIVLVQPNCSYPKLYTSGVVMFMITLIILFNNFYNTSYKNQKKNKVKNI